MPIVNGYATLAQFKTEWVQLSLTIDDAKIERAITAASRAIDNFCERQFWQFTGARRFDACDQRVLDIDDLVSITTVKTDEDGDGTFETIWAVSDFQLLPLNPAAEPELRPFDQVRAVLSRTWPLRILHQEREGRIEITGTWGWTAIPIAIEQACLLITNRIVKRPGSPEGIAGFDEFGVIRISSRDDPDAVRLLEPYWHARMIGI